MADSVASERAAAAVAQSAERGASVAMDQKVAAGIGNWIADECLYQSKVHPETLAKTLTTSKLGLIREKMSEIIIAACKANADADKFPKEWLFHSRWGKVAGSMNGHRIKFITVGGRTTAFVPGVPKKVGLELKKEAKSALKVCLP